MTGYRSLLCAALERRALFLASSGGGYDPTAPFTRAQMAVFISKTWGYQTPTPSATRRNFVYDSSMHLIAESSLTSAFDPEISYEYIWLGDRLVAQEDVSLGQTLWMVTDHLGTPFMATFATRTTAWRIEYKPYGWVYCLRSGTDRHQPLRLPGQEAEQLNLGLNGATEKRYNIFRWYHPKWGRYSQVDPLRIFGDPHPFAYALNNPARNTDPQGRRTLGVGGSFCVDADCKCLASWPLKLKGEDSTSFVPMPKPGSCATVDAIYSWQGVLKVRDFGRCRLRCSGGVPQDVACTLLPPTTFFPCGKEPKDWPPNDLCLHKS